MSLFLIAPTLGPNDKPLTTSTTKRPVYNPVPVTTQKIPIYHTPKPRNPSSGYGIPHDKPLGPSDWLKVYG